MNLDSYTTPPTPVDAATATALLFSPLPADLPTVNKDLLILMAAYYGDIDRYARLRRPMLIKHELGCIVRGILHNTLFAKWWSLQNLNDRPPRQRMDGYTKRLINEAITARFIMNNDLSRVLAKPETAPECIWYPTLAHSATYRELARRVPSMVKTVAWACIVANYEDVYRDLPDFEPDEELMEEAWDSRNGFYFQDLKRRAAERDIRINRDFAQESQVKMAGKRFLEFSTNILRKTLSPDAVSSGSGGIYNGVACNAREVELFVCTPDEWKREEYQYIEDIYENDKIV